MDRHLKPIDKQFEEADYTGILDLSGRKLRIFPTISDEVCEPLEVFEADLSGNRYDKIPPPIFRCRNLTRLSLYNNSLRNIPPEICDLVNLKHLDLSRNFLQSLPPSVCSVPLHCLSVNNNRLGALPANIGKMKSLRSLDLSCNELTELPPTFADMGKLIHLNLHRNDIRELPYEISSVPLQHLDVSANQLSRLPLNLCHLQTLVVFKCDDNPLQVPPAQVCMRGLVHIIKYLKDVEKYGSDAGQSHDSLMRRRRERIVKKTSRPVSDASSLSSSSSSDGGEKSLIDEMTNFVHSAFGDENRRWTAQFRLHDDRTSRQTRMHEEYQRLYREQELQRKNKGPFRSQSPNPIGYQSGSPQLGGVRYGTLPRSGKEEESVSSLGVGQQPPAATRSLSDQPRISSNPDLSTAGMSREADRAISQPSSTQHLQVHPTTKPGLQGVSPSSSGDSTQEDIPGSPCSSRDGSITPTNEEMDMVGEEPTTPRSAKDGEEEGTLVFTMEVTPTSSTTISTPVHEPQEEQLPPPQPPPVKMVSFSAEVSEIPRNSFSPEGEDYEEEESEGTQTESSSITSSGSITSSSSYTGSSSPTSSGSQSLDDVDDTEKEFAQALEEMAEIVSTPLDEEMSPTLASPGADREKSSSLSPSPAPEGVEKPKGPPAKPKPHVSASPSHGRPRKHRKKDVRSIIESARDPNFTYRRQQFHIKEELEKVQNVRLEMEALLNVELADDLGESVSNGVLLCQLVNKLHPGIIPTIHKPRQGEALSVPKQTMNVAAFIAACRKLGVQDLCSAGDILEFKDPVRVITCIRGILDTV